ncbi:unnamed protein product [Amoebophrya sp. A120]|nr:unnamed protein product [Amoebophrya sp. A120]|eukprot:GSA120T00004570001.1
MLLYQQQDENSPASAAKNNNKQPRSSDKKEKQQKYREQFEQVDRTNDHVDRYYPGINMYPGSGVGGAATGHQQPDTTPKTQAPTSPAGTHQSENSASPHPRGGRSASMRANRPNPPGLGSNGPSEVGALNEYGEPTSAPAGFAQVGGVTSPQLNPRASGLLSPTMGPVRKGGNSFHMGSFQTPPGRMSARLSGRESYLSSPGGGTTPNHLRAYTPSSRRSSIRHSRRSLEQLSFQEIEEMSDDKASQYQARVAMRFYLQKCTANDLSEEELIDRVKLCQKLDAEIRTAWIHYTTSEARGVRDPQKHDREFLMNFICGLQDGTMEKYRKMRNPHRGQTANEVFVGGIGVIAPEAVEAYFRRFGPLRYVDVKKDKGFGFVKFDNKDIMAVALSQKEHIIEGKRVEIKPAENRAPNKEVAAKWTLNPPTIHEIGTNSGTTGAGADEASKPTGDNETTTPKSTSAPDPNLTDKQNEIKQKYKNAGTYSIKNGLLSLPLPDVVAHAPEGKMSFLVDPEEQNPKKYGITEQILLKPYKGGNNDKGAGKNGKKGKGKYGSSNGAAGGDHYYNSYGAAGGPRGGKNAPLQRVGGTGQDGYYQVQREYSKESYDSYYSGYSSNHPAANQPPTYFGAAPQDHHQYNAHYNSHPRGPRGPPPQHQPPPYPSYLPAQQQQPMGVSQKGGYALTQQIVDANSSFPGTPYSSKGTASPLYADQQQHLYHSNPQTPQHVPAPHPAYQQAVSTGHVPPGYQMVMMPVNQLQNMPGYQLLPLNNPNDYHDSEYRDSLVMPDYAAQQPAGHAEDYWQPRSAAQTAGYYSPASSAPRRFPASAQPRGGNGNVRLQ